MSEIQKQGEDGSTTPAKQEGEDKVWYAKLADSDLSLVSIYDLVTWVGIPICISLAFVFALQKSWRALGWSVVGLLLLMTVMLAIRARQHRRTIEAKASQLGDRPLPSATMARPEIYVERAIARPLVAGHEKAVALWLKNGGTKPALNITVWINQAFGKPDFKGPLKYTFLEPDTRPDCAPGAIVSLLGKSKGTIAQWEIDALNKREALWFHFGKGMYEDDLGNSYPFDFCFMYEPTLSDMRICPDCYWPSKRDSKPLAPAMRPEIVLASAEGRCVAGDPPRVTMKIVNAGKVSAHRIELESTHFFAHAKTFKGPVEHEPNVPPYVFPVLPPDYEAEGHTEGGPPFTAQDVTDIEGGKLLFINYSTAKYEDEAGNFYPFEFCVLYKPGTPLMEIAPKSFWPKKNDHG
jgi:hypothetical protein